MSIPDVDSTDDLKSAGLKSGGVGISFYQTCKKVPGAYSKQVDEQLPEGKEIRFIKD